MSRPTLAPSVQPLLYTLPAAGAALGCAESKIRELIAAGRLKAIEFDGRPRVTHAALEAFVAELAAPKRKLRSVRS